jgi:DNA-binding NtrC family response regulator
MKDETMSKPLRVLIVEDSEADALLTIGELKKGGYDPEYERVETAETMRTALREKIWDVILCDYRLPHFNGLAAIALLKETNIDIPLIIVSGTIGEETAVECMRLGARDYVMKDNLPRLASAVERELKEAESRRQRKRAEEKIQKSEERLRDLIFSIADWVWETDENGVYTYSSV